MIRLSVSNDHLTALFSCEFCGVEYKWPFGARILWKGQPGQQTYPDMRHVILGHFWGDSNLSKYGFPACPNSQQWHDTEWQTIDVDDATNIATGKVAMNGGWPSVD
jgi:hypothetical protein